MKEINTTNLKESLRKLDRMALEHEGLTEGEINYLSQWDNLLDKILNERSNTTQKGGET